MAFRVATWNVNSVRLRLDIIQELAQRWSPDVLCLQEIKVVTEDFPLHAFETLGYKHHIVHGMKSYNGVAIFSRIPLVDKTVREWCGKEDRRHVMAMLENGIELHNFYVPAGGDIPDPKLNEKFDHKLKFLRETRDWFAANRTDKHKMVLVGDLNIAPLETDVWSHRQLLDVVSHTPIEVEGLNAWQKAGHFHDAVRRIIDPTQKLYSWWSYRNRDWNASDRGRRLDHIWVSPPLAAAVSKAEIIREARGWDKASDHVPVMIDLR